MTRTKKTGIIVAYVKENTEDHSTVDHCDHNDLQAGIKGESMNLNHYITTPQRIIPINGVECNLALCVLEETDPVMIGNLWDMLISSVNHRLELEDQSPISVQDVQRFVGPVFSKPVTEDTIYG